MSNAQDLLSILGGGAIRSGGRGAATSMNNEKSILTFKAGKMTTELRPVSFNAGVVADQVGVCIVVSSFLPSIL